MFALTCSIDDGTTDLFAQLFFAQLVECVEFLRQRHVLAEPAGSHFHPNDRQPIRHHHGHGSKVNLQVLGQLLATGIARIHREEDTELGIHFDEIAIGEDELPFAFLLTREHDGNLLSSDGQDRQVDSIEFIETTE